MVRSVFEDNIDTILTITIIDKTLDHAVIFGLLFLVPRPRFGDDAGQLADGVHQLALNRFL